ncbi:MAG: sigma-70 family RNA polymerase sigma factor [Verrucomicrobia bacterium]|nr:MAG: sigma-70 family RNA polymerase sigma factor [Verrucomicrobiota bacterium]
MPYESSRAGATSNESRVPCDFTQTHWTTVLHAQGTTVGAGEALNRLCRKYWPPVYAFIRRRWPQHGSHKAEDLTQGFFSEFIRKFPNLDIGPDKGKFRSYLLACLSNYLRKDWERSKPTADVVVPTDELEAAAATKGWAASLECTPERAFDIVWATTVVEKSLQTLREEYVSSGKGALHDRLLPLLTGRAEAGGYAAMAAELRLSEGALRVASHEFRRRFGQILRAEVADTVARPEDTDEELRYLLSLWAGGSSTK